MRILSILLLWLAQPMLAAPTLATTIPPITGLVAGLTAGITQPTGLVEAGADPHSFSLRPSQLSMLGEADIIFAMGLGIEPWLEPAIIALGRGARVTYLEDFNPNLLFARNFDFSAKLEQDPHLWLDPGAMIPWILEITQRLILADPANTAVYRRNEFALLKEVVAAKEAMEDIGMQMQRAGIQLIVSHDAYQYLERRLGVSAIGMLSDQSDVNAGARSLSKTYRTQGPVCLIGSLENPLPEDLFPHAPRITINPMGAGVALTDGFASAYYFGIISALETCLTQPEG